MYVNVEGELAKKKLKKGKVALEMGVSHQTLNNWINEITPIPAWALKKLAEILGCTIDYLLQKSDRG